MYKYTFADIIMDPTDPRLKDAIGKECYFADCPKGVLNLANNTSDTFRLRSIDMDGEYPFVDDEHGYEWAVIIIMKEEPKPKYIPFENIEEFLVAYRLNKGKSKMNIFLKLEGVWLGRKDTGSYYMVTEIWDDGVVLGHSPSKIEWDELLEDYTFTNGSPCGKRDREMHEYTFTEFTDLQCWLKSRSDDKEEHYYYGDIDCMDGELYTIKDILHDAEPSWFEDGGVSTIYEFLD